MAALLNVIGVISIIAGVVLCLLVLDELDKPSMSFFGGRTSGELTPGEIAVGIAVFFYHFVLGLICLSLAQLLTKSD